MKHKLYVAVALAGLAIVIAVSPILGADDIKRQIDAANAEFGRLFEADDAAGLAARYTENGELLPPNAEAISGRAGIEVYWKAAVQGAGKVTLTALEVEQHGDTAIETGHAELADATGKQMDAAKYIVIWKRVGGEWKMHKDIFNSNLPAH